MGSFLKTVSATFAAGVVCGAGALTALAPVTTNDTAEPGGARPSNAPAVVSATAVPCSKQVWPIMDRRCMRWTAEGWTNASGAPNGAANPELAAAREDDELRTAAKLTSPAQESPSPPAESRRVARTSAAGAPRRVAEASPSARSQTAEHRKKAARKSQLARSRNRDGDDRDHRGYRGYDDRAYGAYRDYDDRARRRTAGAWGDDASDVFARRRVVSRQKPYYYMAN
jgi:hypothetical protein